MKTKNILILSLSIISVIWISGCESKARMTSPRMSAPPSISVSRYAHIEEKFENIAESIDPEEVIDNVQQVLEMCESGNASMMVYKEIAETRFLYLDSSIRYYMDILPEMDSYKERIDQVDYNEDGKITRIIQTRE